MKIVINELLGNIKQCIPAEDWWFKIYNKAQQRNFYIKAICWAIYENNTIKLLGPDDINYKSSMQLSEHQNAEIIYSTNDLNIK